MLKVKENSYLFLNLPQTMVRRTCRSFCRRLVRLRCVDKQFHKEIRILKQSPRVLHSFETLSFVLTTEFKLFARIIVCCYYYLARTQALPDQFSFPVSPTRGGTKYRVVSQWHELGQLQTAVLLSIFGNAFNSMLQRKLFPSTFFSSSLI